MSWVSNLMCISSVILLFISATGMMSCHQKKQAWLIKREVNILLMYTQDFPGSKTRWHGKNILITYKRSSQCSRPDF